ncbi:MAG: hypothetical protein OXG96_11355 [Acidobacteria bacterium]|nr:hypothetical protein [Acidobacteriota bacterium]
MSTTSLFRLALATLVFASLSCQTAEDRRAAELRDSLRDRVNEIEPLNAKVIAEYEAYLENRVVRGDKLDIAMLRKSLEQARTNLPQELDDLRQRIENYPNSGLPELDQEVNSVIESRQRQAERVAKERRDAVETDKIYDEWKGSGERLMEALKPKW